MDPGGISQSATLGIEVENTIDGFVVGTCFFIRLPVETEQPGDTLL